MTVAIAVERYTTVCHPFFKVQGQKERRQDDRQRQRNRQINRVRQNIETWETEKQIEKEKQTEAEKEKQLEQKNIQTYGIDRGRQTDSGRKTYRDRES